MESKGKIFIGDDDKLVASTAQRMLRRKSYEVTTVHVGGIEPYRDVEALTPDKEIYAERIRQAIKDGVRLLLLDIETITITQRESVSFGVFDVLEILREELGGIAVLLMTGLTDEALEKKPGFKEASDLIRAVIHKPFDSETLLEAVASNYPQT